MDSSKVCKLNFPLYCCECLGDENFVVAGGGGAAKTGVRNCIQILQLQKDKKYVVANPIDEFDTGAYAVMKMAVSIEGQAAENVFMLATALGNKCALYSVTKTKAGSKKSASSTEGVKKRKKSESDRKSGVEEVDSSSRLDHHSFQLVHNFAISNEEKISQTSVALSREGHLLVAGLSSGHIKLWNTRDQSLVFEHNGHKNEVTDVDISPDGSKVVSVSRDGTACLWSVEHGHKINDLHSTWNMAAVTRTYKFRNCKFSFSPETRDHKRSPSRFSLFTTHEPLKRPPRNVRHCTTTKTGSYITKWVQDEKDDKGGMRLQMYQKTGNETISALAVSRDGSYLSLGFMDGSVEIYIAFRLQRAYRIPAAHSIFVTAVSMLDDTDKIHQLTGDCDARCVSVSANGFCHVGTLKPRAMCTIWFIILVCVLLIGGFAIAFYISDSPVYKL